MLRNRIIPVLLLSGRSLIKTVTFKGIDHIGDPSNTARIFNELEVDELFLLNISEERAKIELDRELLGDFASQCFMPVAFGGGINSVEKASEILSLGFEKVVVNTATHQNRTIISELSDRFGSQAVVASIDVGLCHNNGQSVYFDKGRVKADIHPLTWAKQCQERGAGELLITSIKDEGTWNGLNVDLAKLISEELDIPVIINGGANSIENINQVFEQTSVSGVAASSLFLYQKKGMGVLVNFPCK